MLPRRVKPSWTPETVNVVPLPGGRRVIKQYTQTYIADSTITNLNEGIDAGYGLFASRPFKANSNDIICYYEGTVMSREEVNRVQNDPSYTRTTGFIIDYHGIIIDGWDHNNDFYASPGAAVNDFLDDRNNSYFDTDSSDDDSDDDGDYKPKKRT